MKIYILFGVIGILAVALAMFGALFKKGVGFQSQLWILSVIILVLDVFAFGFTLWLNSADVKPKHVFLEKTEKTVEARADKRIKAPAEEEVANAQQKQSSPKLTNQELLENFKLPWYEVAKRDRAFKRLIEQNPSNNDLLLVIKYEEFSAIGTAAYELLIERNPSNSDLLSVIENGYPALKTAAFTRLMEQNPSNAELLFVVKEGLPFMQVKAGLKFLERNPDNAEFNKFLSYFELYIEKITKVLRPELAEKIEEKKLKHSKLPA